MPKKKPSRTHARPTPSATITASNERPSTRNMVDQANAAFAAATATTTRARPANKVKELPAGAIEIENEARAALAEERAQRRRPDGGININTSDAGGNSEVPEYSALVGELRARERCEEALLECARQLQELQRRSGYGALSCSEQVLTLEATVRDLSASLREQRSRCAQLTEENADLRIQLERREAGEAGERAVKENEFSRHAQIVGELEAVVDLKNGEVASLTRQLRTLKHELEDSERKLGEVRSDADRLRTDLDTSRSRMAEMGNALVSERQRVAQLQDGADEEIQLLRDHRAYSAKQLDTVEGELTDVTSELHALRSEACEAERRLTEARSLAEERGAALRTLEQEHAEASRALDEVGRARTSAEEDLRVLRAERDAADRKISALERTRTEASDETTRELEQAARRLAASQAVQRTLKSELEQQRKLLREAHEEAARAQAEADTRIASLEHSMAGLYRNLQTSTEMHQRHDERARQRVTAAQQGRARILDPFPDAPEAEADPGTASYPRDGHARAQADEVRRQIMQATAHMYTSPPDEDEGPNAGGHGAGDGLGDSTAQRQRTWGGVRRAAAEGRAGAAVAAPPPPRPSPYAVPAKLDGRSMKAPAKLGAKPARRKERAEAARSNNPSRAQLRKARDFLSSTG